MSKYTTELRFVCEVESGLVESKGFNDIDTILTNCRSHIFNFEYPIFDETYRPILEKKILKHYYTREICAETVGLWKHYLDMRLNDIMPYYNKLYQSELLQFNPLYDVDLTRDHTQSGTNDTAHEGSNTETNSNTRTDNLTRTDAFTRTDNLTTNRDSERTDNLTRTDAFTRTDNLKSTSQDSGTQGDSGSDIAKNTRWDTYSDTPQGALTNVQNENYLTNARKIVDDGTGSTHSNTTTFGKKVVVDDTGTQQNGGTSKNTGTQVVDESETHTGTQQNSGTSKNTGTQVVDETETHTGTQQNSGTSANTGTQRNEGSKSASTEFTTGITTTEEYLEHVRGKSGGVSYSKMLQEYRETFLNIDMQIIDELSDLFFGLW